MEGTRICVQVYVYVAFIIVAVTANDYRDEVDCPGPVRYYNDLGCTPMYKHAWDDCAFKYDCSNIAKRSRDKCYINGHEYSYNQVLQPEDSSVCDELCFCKYGANDNEIAAFECIDIKCPKVVAKRGCYLRYNPSKCCGDPVELCPNFPEDRAICVVNGREYLDGQYFNVEDDPTLICTCHPRYRGKNVPPFCIKSNYSPCINHPAFDHRDYFREKCAPVYINERHPGKCILYMRCQSNSDIIFPGPSILFASYNKRKQPMCLFGNLKLRISDRLHPSTTYPHLCITCICKVPPLLSCEFNYQNSVCLNMFNISYSPRVLEQ